MSFFFFKSRVVMRLWMVEGIHGVLSPHPPRGGTPRAPASGLWEMVALMRAPASPEIVRHSGYGPMTFPAAVRPGRVAVGVVLQAVAAVDREEREARVGLLHPASRSEPVLTPRSPLSTRPPSPASRAAAG